MLQGFETTSDSKLEFEKRIVQILKEALFCQRNKKQSGSSCRVPFDQIAVETEQTYEQITKELQANQKLQFITIL